MQVETFECQETASEPIEASEEAIGLINKLGLKGQQSLVSPNPNLPSAETRSPYRLMTAEERFVYLTLCPERTSIEEYDDGPIPLRVLQIGSHAKDIGVGNTLQVWHRAAPVVKDPVLVASDESKSSFYRGKTLYNSDKIWILARWGEELDTFALLMEKATAIVRERLAAEAKSAMHAVENMTFAQICKIGHSICVEVH